MKYDRKNKDFGGRLQQLRKQRDLKQTDAASLIGISYSSLQGHEGGQWPNRNNLQKYVGLYGCDKDWLITGKGDPFADGREIEAQGTESVSMSDWKEGATEPAEINSDLVKTINRLLDKNDRLEAKNDALEAELKQYREAAAQYDEKKSDQHRPLI